MTPNDDPVVDSEVARLHVLHLIEQLNVHTEAVREGLEKLRELLKDEGVDLDGPTENAG